jgi:hypothetical protein
VFERAVMDRERDTEDFAFLFDSSSPEHRYYRWRVFSLAQGDTLSRQGLTYNRPLYNPLLSCCWFMSCYQ